jgi:hypothetical protein
VISGLDWRAACRIHDRNAAAAAVDSANSASETSGAATQSYGGRMLGAKFIIGTAEGGTRWPLAMTTPGFSLADAVA